MQSFLYAALFALAVNGAAVGPRDNHSDLLNNIVVFGDSYSDNCNLWRLLAEPAVAAAYPFPSCPSAPTGRWSGGFAWPEILQNATAVAVHNYAVAGATCSNTYFNRTIGAVLVPGVDDQIKQFQSYEGKEFNFGSSLAVMFIGTNDVNFFTNELQYNPVTEVLAPGRVIPDEAKCIVERVEQAVAAGFSRVVLFNQIPLERSPYFSENNFAGYGQHIIQNGTAVSILVKQLVAANNALQAAYIPYQVSNAGKAQISFFDTHALFTDILDNPTSTFGQGADVGAWCKVCKITMDDTDCAVCETLENFAWWDPLHPSQRSDEVIAERFAKSLGLPYNWTA